jgi:hypothetical protein
MRAEPARRRGPEQSLRPDIISPDPRRTGGASGISDIPLIEVLLPHPAGDVILQPLGELCIAFEFLE